MKFCHRWPCKVSDVLPSVSPGTRTRTGPGRRPARRNPELITDCSRGLNGSGTAQCGKHPIMAGRHHGSPVGPTLEGHCGRAAFRQVLPG
eukprot:766510-Hanusia_phi.AAC.5